MPSHQSVDDPWIGRVLAGRYRIVALIGVGGMGLVYRAWDLAEDRYVVVKAPRRERVNDAGFLQRFARELAIIRRLSFPAIVAITDTGSEPLEHNHRCSLPYAVMPYLAGGTLKQRRSKRNRRDSTQSMRDLWMWLPRVADALDRVHAEGIVHRDVKPDNILFDGIGQAYLGDFGIAKAIRSAEESSGHGDLTADGLVVGSPHYMAPELIDDNRPQGTADQYSLAVMAYEQIAGRKPFRGSTVAAILGGHAAATAPSLAGIHPALPPSLVAAISRGMSKLAADRFPTCRAFAAALLADVPPPSATVTPQLICPNCGLLLHVQPQWAGMAAKCTACGEPLAVSSDLQSLWLQRDRRGPARSWGRWRRTLDWINGHGIYTAIVSTTVVVLLLLVLRAAGRQPVPAVDERGPTPADVGDMATAERHEPPEPKPAPAEPAGARVPNAMQAAVGPVMEGGGADDKTLESPPAPPDPEEKPSRDEPLQPARPAVVDLAPAKKPGKALPAPHQRPNVPAPDRPAPRKPDHMAADPPVAHRQPLPDPTTKRDPGTIIVNHVGMKLVLIPAGSFRAGDHRSDNVLRHRSASDTITISRPFWLGQTEVTRKQWREVMQMDGKASHPWPKTPPDGEELPATHMTWDQADEFCHRLTILEHEALTLPVNERYCLPTEAQWEYARAANNTAAGQPTPDADNMAMFGWFRENSQALHDVGQRLPTAWKLYDMHGNVREWCADWYDDTRTGGTDPTGPRTPSIRFGHAHVCRGGSYLTESALGNRSADRSGEATGARDCGFRVARIVE